MQQRRRRALSLSAVLQENMRSDGESLRGSEGERLKVPVNVTRRGESRVSALRTYHSECTVTVCVDMNYTPPPPNPPVTHCSFSASHDSPEAFLLLVGATRAQLSARPPTPWNQNKTAARGLTRVIVDGDPPGDENSWGGHIELGRFTRVRADNGTLRGAEVSAVRLTRATRAKPHKTNPLRTRLIGIHRTHHAKQTQQNRTTQSKPKELSYKCPVKWDDIRSFKVSSGVHSSDSKVNVY